MAALIRILGYLVDKLRCFFKAVFGGREKDSSDANRDAQAEKRVLRSSLRRLGVDPDHRGKMTVRLSDSASRDRERRMRSSAAARDDREETGAAATGNWPAGCGISTDEMLDKQSEILQGQMEPKKEPKEVEHSRKAHLYWPPGYRPTEWWQCTGIAFWSPYRKEDGSVPPGVIRRLEKAKENVCMDPAALGSWTPRSAYVNFPPSLSVLDEEYLDDDTNIEIYRHALDKQELIACLEQLQKQQLDTAEAKEKKNLRRLKQLQKQKLDMVEAKEKRSFIAPWIHKSCGHA